MHFLLQLDVTFDCEVKRVSLLVYNVHYTLCSVKHQVMTTGNKLKQVDIAYGKAIMNLLMSICVLDSGLPWNTTILWRIASIRAFTPPGC